MLIAENETLTMSDDTDALDNLDLESELHPRKHATLHYFGNAVVNLSRTNLTLITQLCLLNLL